MSRIHLTIYSDEQQCSYSNLLKEAELVYTGDKYGIDMKIKTTNIHTNWDTLKEDEFLNMLLRYTSYVKKETQKAHHSTEIKINAIKTRIKVIYKALSQQESITVEFPDTADKNITKTRDKNAKDNASILSEIMAGPFVNETEHEKLSLLNHAKQHPHFEQYLQSFHHIIDIAKQKFILESLSTFLEKPLDNIKDIIANNDNLAEQNIGLIYKRTRYITL